ncbi:MAG: LamG domain-containing protein, partial [Planctomycetota bacterium]
MRTQRVSLIALLVVILALPLNWAGSPQPGPITWVKFDDLPDGWRVDDDYAWQGVHFLNDYEIGGEHRASPQIKANANAPTGPNVLVNDYYDDEIHSSYDVPMVIWLDEPAAGVGMWLGTMETNQFACNSVQATVSVYDCAGAFIDSNSVTVTKAFDTSLEIYDANEKIQKVVIDYGKSSCPEGIDDFAFMAGSGTCTDTTPPTVRITSHYDQVVNSAAQTIKGAVVEPGILKSVKINGVQVGFHLSNNVDPAFQSYWMFDEGSGNSAYDSVGSDDCTLVNGPTWIATGKIGSAISFDGLNDYAGTALNIDQSQYSPGVTMLMWVNPTSLSPGKHQVISTDDGGWDWSVLRVGDKWQVFTGNTEWDTGFSVDQNTWQYIAAVFDPSTGIRFYKNGQEASTSDIGYDPNDSNIRIGRNPGGGEYFEGEIDEVAVYKRPLTKDEINKLYYQSKDKDGDHYFYPVRDATYYFSSKVTLKEGSNTFTVLAQNGAGLKDSDKVTLTLGTPLPPSLEQFHLTQRGVMKNEACDVDTPLVAGKSAIVRISLDVKSASGADTYVSSVEMELWRKKQGGDEFVHKFYGTGYSPFLSVFNTPNHMTAIHFWIPGEKLEPAGEYKFVFQPYAGLDPLGSPLVANCDGEYQTFTETRPIKLYLLPVEVGPNSAILKGTDYAKNLWRMLDCVQRTYPVRDGVSSFHASGVQTGVKVDVANPYNLCDGATKTSYCDPGIGYTWRFIDKDPGGLLRRAHDQKFRDPNQPGCNLDDPNNIGGRIISDPNTTTFTYAFDPNLGIYRAGAHPGWKGAKHSPPQDEDHDGDIDGDDLKHYVAEFYDEQTNQWTTDLTKFDVYNSSDLHGETFRFFEDTNDNNCNDSKVEPQADIRLLWENQNKILYSGKVNDNETKAYNEKMPGTQNDADFGILVFPDQLISSDSSFGDIGPGQGGGDSAWIKEG